MKKDSLKRKLVAEIEKLPEDRLPKVLDLVEKLKTRQKAQKLALRPKRKLNPAKNPLRGLIGIAEERFEKAKRLRLKFQDKPRISFTDLTSMVVMQERRLTRILTEDEHFTQVGMKLR